MDAHQPGTLKRVPIPEEFVGESYNKLFDHFRSNGWVLISVYSEDEQIGIGEILSSDSSALDAFIERKLRRPGTPLAMKTRQPWSSTPQTIMSSKKMKERLSFSR